MTLFRSLSTMMQAGVSLFATFEFLARSSETQPIREMCSRISGRLASGHPLPAAVRSEKECFDVKSVRILEAGYKSGGLDKVLARLAKDEEAAWALQQKVKSQLVYPLGIASITTLGVLLLPPLVLTDFLEQLVQLGGEPPPLTRFILTVSGLVGHPVFILCLVLLAGLTALAFRSSYREKIWSRIEPYIWELPGLGSLWQTVVSIRFVQVFSMAYETGMPATASLEMAASSTGSVLAHNGGARMKRALVEGEPLWVRKGPGQAISILWELCSMKS